MCKPPQLVYMWFITVVQYTNNMGLVRTRQEREGNTREQRTEIVDAKKVW